MTDVDVVEIIPAYLETSRTPITSMSDQEFETFISLTTGGGDYYEAVSKSEKYIYATALVALSQSECLAEDPEKLAEVESNPELYSQAYLNDMDVLVASIGGLDDLADNFCYSKSEVIEECKDELTEYYDAEGAFITADGPDVFDSLDVCGNEVPQGLMYDADSSCGDGVCNIANEENSKSCAADCLYSGSKCVNEADNKLIGAIEIDNEVYGDELVENKAKINCLGDLEYYKMLVDDGETLSVKVTVYDDDNSQSLDRAIVYITDSSNELLTASASYDIYDSACVSVTNNSGQNGVAYHAIVHGLGDSFTGTYTIEVSTTLNCDDMFGGIVVQ